MRYKSSKSNKKRMGAARFFAEQKIAKKLRSKYECNPKLSELIWKANLLPDWRKNAKTELILQKLYILRSSDFVSTLDEDVTVTLIKWGKTLSELPDDIKSYVSNSWQELEPYIIKEFKQSGEYSFITIDKYLFYNEIAISRDLVMELFEIKEFLSDLALLADNYEKRDQISKNSSDEKHLVAKLYKSIDLRKKTSEIFPGSLVKPISCKQQILGEGARIVDYFVDKDGKIHFHLSQLAIALQDVNISRIRVCEICGIFFWASRSDSYACSKKHAKARKMRLLRQRLRENAEQLIDSNPEKGNRRKKQEKK